MLECQLAVIFGKFIPREQFNIQLASIYLSFLLSFSLLSFRFSACHGSLERRRSISISRTIRCGQPDGNYVNHVTSPASTPVALGDPHKCTGAGGKRGKGGKGGVSESRKSDWATHSRFAEFMQFTTFTFTLTLTLTFIYFPPRKSDIRFDDVLLYSLSCYSFISFRSPSRLTYHYNVK